MAVPKKKLTRSRRGNRRAGKSLSPPNLSTCSHCGQPKPTHVICPSCGYYRGEPFVQVKE